MDKKRRLKINKNNLIKRNENALSEIVKCSKSNALRVIYSIKCIY